MDYCKSFAPGGAPDKIAGVVFGHALGDAVGFTTEYKPQGTRPNYPYTDGMRGVKPNDWTDDTDLMLVAMGSLIDSNMRFSPIDVAFKFKYWLEKGLVQTDYTAPKTPSNLFREIVSSSEYIKDPIKAAAEIDKKSNGTLNTNLPLCYIAFAGFTRNPRDCAINFCKMTNPDNRCIAACVFYATALHKLVYRAYDKLSIGEIIQSSIEEAAEFYDLTPIVSATSATATSQISHFELDVEPVNDVFKCLKCAIWALRVCDIALSNGKIPRMLDTLKAVAMQGGDADANCGVVGSILGACFGYHTFDASTLPYCDRLSGFTAFFINRLFMPNNADENATAAGK
jgi:ADP-ribosylglycohydrolase